ncbi:MAG: hypothetical protein U1F43_04660 [Myxococcota bacterium]
MLALAGPARAADPPPSGDPVVQCKELSARAEAAYQARQYQAAIDAYLEAYGVLASADVLYNIAYIYDHHLQRLDLAQDFYRRVIRMPDSTKEILELSMKRLSEIEAREAVRAPLLEGPKDPPPVADPNHVDARVTLPPADDGPGAAPWVLVTLGGASLVGAAIMGLVAQSTNDDYARLDDVAAMRRTEDRGRQQALAADVLGIGGGVLVGSGLIWFFAGGGASAAASGESRVELPALRPMLGGGAVGVTWEGRL